MIKYKLICAFFFLLFITACSEDDSHKIFYEWEASGAEYRIDVIYPRDSSIFPPEIIAPKFLWDETNSTDNGSSDWIVFIKDGDEIIYTSENLKVKQWIPDSTDWEFIKQRSMEKEVKVIIIGHFNNNGQNKIVSASELTIKTSQDSVIAPIFYRSVPLPFGYAIDHLKEIKWKLGEISSYESAPAVIDELPVCGNCHSFSNDGKYIGMDVDYGNDKGSYYISPVSKNMKMEYENIITWSDYKKEDGENTFGLLSQISPDGKWVLSTVKDRSIFVKIDELYYSQLFFPIKGIIGIYNTETGVFSALPGADNPAYCQSNPIWIPDGREVMFARADYIKVDKAESSNEVVIPTEYAKDFIEGKTEYKFDLYRIPFNDGNGGVAVPVLGASNNGKSNFFPKYSPDGKWVVFTQAENFMLLQPDAKLYIIPAQGGKPRLMNCNNPNTMNSWHSWSPNGKWMVFSSKARGPYTQLYLTHIDNDGNDSPPIFLEKLSEENSAANIPEFVNIEKKGIESIIENFMDRDNYGFIRGKDKLAEGDLVGALEDVNKSLAIDPDNPVSYNLRALIKIEQGDYQAAIEDFNKIISLTPDRFDAYANRAAAKFNLKDYTGAINDLNKTIELNPKGSRGYFSRGTAKYNIEDYYGAIKDYNQSLKLNPNNADAWFERGIAKLQIQQLKEACEDLKMADELGNEYAKEYIIDFCN